MPTPHISAPDGALAEAILLPGDPLRAAHIAENFLDKATQVTGVRNMLGFTGSYHDMGVSVMGTGMGVPSASIYITELIRNYECQRLVRVGSCGGISGDIGLRDVIVATGACTDSAVNRARYSGWDFAAVPDFDLARAAVAAAVPARLTLPPRLVHTSDSPHNPAAQPAHTTERVGQLPGGKEDPGP